MKYCHESMENETDRQIFLKSVCENLQAGLSFAEVEERKRKGLSNEMVDSSTNDISEIIKSNIFTYFNLIFCIIAILLALVGSFRDLTFVPIIICNTLIGIFQELRSKKILDELSILNTPKITVIREHTQQAVYSEELVLGDVILLSAGNQIPADAVILSGMVFVNEALITGEADEIPKKEKEMLLSGSFVVSGNCTARLERVGNDSYISGLMLQATKTKEGEQSEMIRSLNKLVKAVGIVIFPIGIILFTQQFFLSASSIKDSVTSTVAALLGMIPEGLYLLASVAMAVSVWRLGKQNVLVHDMKCIETLARVNVLCVDKTGTITVPEMEVAQFFPAKESVSEEEKQEIAALLADCVKALPCDNATMEALLQYFTDGTKRKPQKIIPFTSSAKYSGVMFDGIFYLIGAPEVLLCTDDAVYAETLEKYQEKGYRVLLFVRYEGELEKEKLAQKSVPVAFLLLNNAVREGAMDTFSYFAKRGVEIKVISGDNPLTVSEIARKAGICHAEKYIDAARLRTKDALKKAAQKYTVFGRVTPEQKQILIHALKEQGKTVAMTGDGVNDILALKEADCSIAMSSGSEAASQVAQLVLLDNDFNKMPSIVMEGRRVVNNLERTAILYLVKNIFSMLLAVFSMIFLINYPLEPSQVSLISLFTIGIPSFFLALEQNKNQICGNFLVNVLMKALPAGITDFAVISCFVVFSQEFGIEEQCVSTSCTILAAIVGFLILFKVAKPMTTVHFSLVVSMMLGWLVCMLFFPDLFGICGISKQCAMLMAVFALITEPILRYLSFFLDKVREILLAEK